MHAEAAVTTKKNDMIFISTFYVSKIIFTAMFPVFFDRNA